MLVPLVIVSVSLIVAGLYTGDIVTALLYSLPCLRGFEDGGLVLLV